MVLNVLAYDRERVLTTIGVDALLEAMAGWAGICATKSGRARSRRLLQAPRKRHGDRFLEFCRRATELTISDIFFRASRPSEQQE